jgi:hypothetical protein
MNVSVSNSHGVEEDRTARALYDPLINRARDMCTSPAAVGIPGEMRCVEGALKPYCDAVACAALV